MINTNQLNSTVLLFVRPENSVYPKPLVVRMDGKSTVQNVDIGQGDMPNFFVEAMTVANGRVHSEMKALYVPPEKRIANIEVKPSKKDYLPGGKAELELKLTDLDGKPFRSPTVVSVYDKSVEYISGGSPIPDVREFFWKIRRNHYVRLQSNLSIITRNVTRPNEKTLQLLGVFGGQVVRPTSSRMGGGGGGLEGRAMPAMGGGRIAESAAADDSAPAMKSQAMNAGPAGAAQVEPTVRTNFADTAYWSAAVQPNDDGIAKVSFDLPDDLTTWKVRTWSIGKDTRVGEAETEFVTRKNVIIRMQAPRFFTERDEVILSANVHNYLDAATTVRVELQLDGEELVATDSLNHTVEVPADGEARVDWTVKVARPGDAVVCMRAITDRESDAVERTFPVLVHGMLKTEAWTGSIASTGNLATFDVRVPAERRPEQTELVIRYSPTLAGAMVDALPYLIDGPHNTTDGKLYRFVPGLIVQRILQRTGVNLADVERKRANLNAQQLGDSKERAKQWKHYKRNPVFSNAEMQAIVKENLNAVVEMQLTDGGWGWFSGWGERSTPHTTATMVHGLQIAKQNDLAVPNEVIERGVAWLKRYEKRQIKRIENWDVDKKRPMKRYADNMDAFVFMVLTDAGASNAKMREYLYRDRGELAACSKAMFGIALHKLKDQQKLAMVVQNLSQFIKRDAENQTAYLQLPGQGWWYWWGNDIEANAWYLKLLARTDPKGQLAPALARYILNNRRNGTWGRSIRDTAIAVESLGDFVTASGEFDPNVELEVFVDGKSQKKVTINRENLFSYEDRVTLEGDNVSSGRHTVEIRKRGKGPLYYSAYLTNFTKEDDIAATGLEIKVLREFYKLIPEERKDLVSGSRGQALQQKGQKYRRERIVNLAEVTSGDLIEVELSIESKNDYDYIVFEDPKPAGFEAVDRTSGYNGNEIGAYVEVRDNRVVLYLSLIHI